MTSPFFRDTIEGPDSFSPEAIKTRSSLSRQNEPCKCFSSAPPSDVFLRVVRSTLKASQSFFTSKVFPSGEKLMDRKFIPLSTRESRLFAKRNPNGPGKALSGSRGIWNTPFGENIPCMESEKTGSPVESRRTTRVKLGARQAK